MWTRAQIKTAAKKSLSKNFIYTTGVYIGYLILSLEIMNLYSSIRSIFDSLMGNTTYMVLNIPFIPFRINASMLISLGILFLFIWIAFILYNIFIVAPLKVGLYRYFIINHREVAKFSDLLTIFNRSGYLNVVKISFIMNLKIFLWSLLLFVPGIIKTYQYGMIPTILAENPNIDSKRAFELSSEMTYGNKMDMFILSLSFLGWEILGIITVVGIIFVNIYVLATEVELYAVLKQKVLDNKFATELDFQN